MKSKHSYDSHSSVKLQKNQVHYVSYIHSSHMKRTVLIFSMCVATTHYSTTVDKILLTICSLWFWHTCDLEIRSRPSNWYDLLEPEQCYNHANFERTPSNSVHQKFNIKVFIKPNMSIVSLGHVQKVENSGIFIICLTYLTILLSFHLTA